jgi:glycosyltransferase involved in cell wall biosynthesis
MSLSIIIPTYNSVQYFDELIESILNNKYNKEYEVLIGIDGCETTLNYITGRVFPDNFFFFYFEENGGPYIIKNTLSELSKFEKLFFFDSDDVMMGEALEEIDSKLNKYDCVKPKFTNFKDKGTDRVYLNDNNLYGEGVFGIIKSIFLNMNGFEGWKVAADSDFMGRIYKMGRKIHLTPTVLFHRRIHNESLTMRKDTGYSSQMRSKYASISKNKKGGSILNEMKKGDYKVLDKESGLLSQSIQQKQIEQSNLERELKERKHKLLETLFSNTPKEVREVKQVKQIDYTQVNRNTNNQTNNILNTALKKAKLENINRNLGRR